MHIRQRAVLTLIALGPVAWAGRPLATDDASTAESGTCQVEGWAERAGGDGATVIAPACGVAPGLELAVDVTVPQRRDPVRSAAGAAVKWVPEAWRTDTPAGALNFGVKLAVGYVRPVDAGWRRAETSALVLASLQPDAQWAVHANLGAAHDRSTGVSAGVLNLALVWSPLPAALLFAEARAHSRREPFGGTVRGAGARWWLLKDRLGLDLTTSREAGAGGPSRWSLGLGWYGLAF